MKEAALRNVEFTAFKKQSLFCFVRFLSSVLSFLHTFKTSFNQCEISKDQFEFNRLNVPHRVYASHRMTHGFLVKGSYHMDDGVNVLYQIKDIPVLFCIAFR